MANHHKQHSWGEISSHFNRIYNHPVSYLVLLSLSYLALLVISYGLGYLRGSSIGAHHLVHRRLATRCTDSVPPELVRQTILDHVYNGTSPYEDLISPMVTKINSSILQKRIDQQNRIYEKLIRTVRPKTIIKLNGFAGGSVTHMANSVRGLNWKTQIIFIGDFQGCPGYNDLLMQNVVSENATEFILPVPISPALGVAKLCEWGIMADLIEVDIGPDSYYIWSDIDRMYRLLRPGGILFGHRNGMGPAVKLFARVNKYRFKNDGQYWMISSA